MDIQGISQALVDDLDKEAKIKGEDVLRLQGAIQGVNLLFQKILNASVEENNEDNKIEHKETKKSPSVKEK